MRLWVAGLLAVFAFGIRPARAHLTYELSPVVGTGATDNVTVASDGQDHFADGFVQVSAVGRARYQAQLSEYALGYRVMLTRYLRESGFDTIAQSVSASSSFSLTGRLTLRLFANGELTHTSSTSPNPDPATFVPQAAIATAQPYYSLAATEDMSYSATPRTTFGETLSLARIHFLGNNSNVGTPTTSVITGVLHGHRSTGRETYSLTAIMSDSIADAAPNTMADPLATGQVFFGQLLAGWGHELSPTWTTQVQAGPAIIFKIGGPAVLSPAGLVAVNYARLPWYMTFAASQAPAPNLLIGQATVTDQVLARVAMPLGRSEMVYVGVFGSYLYAREATEGGSLKRSYDQFQGGASVFARSPRSPIGGSLSYVALTQRGNGVETQSLAWQSVMLNISGTFAWGPGTPPLFGGVL